MRDCKVYSVIPDTEAKFSLAQIQQQAGRYSRAGSVSEIKVYTLMQYRPNQWSEQKNVLEALDSH